MEPNQSLGTSRPDPTPCEFQHISVLSQEVLAGLQVQAGHYLDATVGGGGHSALILAAHPDVRLTALDQDTQALTAAGQRLAEFGERVSFQQCNFAEFDPGELRFAGILADLGVSSAQFDWGERGFSFRQDAPLDMRMNQQQRFTAAEIVNTWDEAELANLIYSYGEERLSRQIARRIVERRPLNTTAELAETIFHSVPRSYRYGRIHPATRSFQALRIAVNRELEVLEHFLQVAPLWLKPQGRLAIISFHSLEDRIVKHALKESELLRVITKKPITPSAAEAEQNPRARSAKLRIAEQVNPSEYKSRNKYENFKQDHA
ncbi:MAG: 16S rRNA (cytosine(1402)-N(4))-methyltransferase RsmH [Pegethrix bostrychoides GSE-TBD4-15B]|uniref:Ribosomal RNA small subunit methyltransferase H n=1 Tax=Pegethrix bostrychoides GSE-TBD4-15B TaxID=2839662 RepID=A0A951P7L6_9CYAN|nr:16S rRNA (cytosine(1402)-N(4))-methyltransferase RsmH [Pegethrix bostrychoides GSE-TBD4-15B]